LNSVHNRVTAHHERQRVGAGASPAVLNGARSSSRGVMA
jgi:hypothetical protein